MTFGAVVYGKYICLYFYFFIRIETYMHGRYITGGESCSPLVSSLFVVVCGRYMIPTRAGGVGSGRLLSPNFVIKLLRAGGSGRPGRKRGLEVYRINGKVVSFPVNR